MRLPKCCCLRTKSETRMTILHLMILFEHSRITAVAHRYLLYSIKKTIFYSINTLKGGGGGYSLGI